MKTINLKISILVLSLLAGCQAGPAIHKLDQSKSPYGANVEFEVSQSASSKWLRLNGELIETRDDGLIIALRKKEDESSRVTFVPWPRTRLIRATELPGIQLRNSAGKTPDPAATEKMRLISRFPQGLSPELMEQLLASFDQVTVDPLR